MKREAKNNPEPHEPPGPLDACLRGEVDEGVAVGGQYVRAWQGAELLPPELLSIELKTTDFSAHHLATILET